MHKNILRIVVGTGIILSVPLIAMQFSDEVEWNLFDFVVMGALLISAGLIFELISSRLDRKYRRYVAVAVIGTVLIIWAELAVGVFGSPFAGS